MKKQSVQFQHLTELLKEVLESFEDIGSAVPAVLAILATRLDGSWAAYWKVDSDAHVLRAITTWSENPTVLRPLSRDTQSHDLALSEGVPGQVWRSGKPNSSSNLIRDMCLPRSIAAQSGGLSAGIWFPVRADHETHGVMELLGKQPWPNDREFHEQLTILGELIGEMLPERRKRS
jgi:hypothetical protein